ncbi:MAG: hypothetical protein M3O20_02030 [Acidobacteriota bacterium]|nr:hypothetical protein [Acidobacteriota bacterium]
MDVNGEKMPLVDAAKASGISCSTVYKRRHKGVTGEQLLAPALKNNATMLVDFEGKQISLAEAAKYAPIDYSSLRRRYIKGIRGVALFAPTTKGPRRRQKGINAIS